MQPSLRRVLDPLYRPVRTRLNNLAERASTMTVLIGQILAERVRMRGRLKRITDAEFRACSQFGEDGIIQYLVHQTPIVDETFVEIGIEKYSEANTRFLLLANKWRGLIVDGGEHYIREFLSSSVAWRSPVTAVCSFVTAENINSLLSEWQIGADIGLFSLDIDGNDYWVWRALEVSRPRIVVCEFNRGFGHDRAITVPYQPSFVASEVDAKMRYYGASLPALTFLAAQKGYSLVGCTSEGVNAFFVRDDVRTLDATTPKECFATLIRVRPSAARDTMTDDVFSLPVVDVTTGETLPLRQALAS